MNILHAHALNLLSRPARILLAHCFVGFLAFLGKALKSLLRRSAWYLFFALQCIQLHAPLAAISAGPPAEPRDDAYIVFNHLLRAYPNAIRNLSFDTWNEDWRIKVNGELFYWAHGRILPKELQDQYENYRPYSFYYYPKKLPDLPFFDAKEEKLFLARMGEKQLKVAESDDFRMALYQAHSKQELEAQLQKVPFLNFRIRVHPMVVWPLKRVERRLLAVMPRSPDLKNFVQGLRLISTFKWRKIQYFEKLSNHSFGTALDFIPKNWHHKASYWVWQRGLRKDWFNTPYQQRWSPPEIVIKAFESEGFVWGGKWLFFDSMHFEYRPELFLLRSYLAEKENAASK